MARDLVGTLSSALTAHEALYIWFFRGQLQEFTASIVESEQVALGDLKDVYREPAEIVHLAPKDACLGGDQYFWRDPKTELVLDVTRDGESLVVQVSLRDRQLTRVAETEVPAPGADLGCD